MKGKAMDAVEARSELKSAVNHISAAGVALQDAPEHAIACLDTADEKLQAAKKYAEERKAAEETAHH
jgi:hypothetical protein